jgi:hypothetical protein
LTLEKYSYSTIIAYFAAALPAIIQTKKKYLPVKHASLLCPSVNYNNRKLYKIGAWKPLEEDRTWAEEASWWKS